ncbi:MAG: RNA methyltransferase [Acidobacteria bacterium]|nr:RNA methyltransferase [Acidobacteriota bacterium]
MQHITSRHNPIVARFRRAARRSTPPDSATLLEGPRLIEEALAAGVGIELAAVSDPLATDDRWSPLLERLGVATEVVRVSTPVMAALSPVSTPSGLVAIATPTPARFESTVGGSQPLVLGLIGVQDPGNTGAVIRAAEAGGATGVVTVAGADPYGWKALRGSMGSTLRFPVVRAHDPDQINADARARGLRLLAAVPHGGTPTSHTDLSSPCLIWLGGEGAGLSAPIRDSADELISVPMRAPVESLNIAVASALIIYEAARQRADGRAVPEPPV